jgi:argonaute-like protein implicated in RNA metabolism and viral defense
MFVKMGGIPYILDRSVISDKISEDTAVFIMGLGISYHPLYKRRGIGFMTIFDHHGTWYFMDSTALILGEKEDISEKLADLFKRAIHQMLTLSESQKNILIVHYSGKEVGHIEEEAIRSAIKKIKSELGKFISVYILKVKDSDIVVGEPGSPYIINNAQTGYPPIGLTFQLKPGLYLMVTSGYFITSSGEKVRGNIRRGLPTVKIISRHEEMEPVEDKIKLNDKQLLATVFGMCRLNYNSIQNPVSRDPITIRYSREIAWLSMRLLELDVNIDKATRIKRIMWFI